MVRRGAWVPILTKEEWEGALRLATMWDMSWTRQLIIREMTGLYHLAADKIRLGREHRVKTWVEQGLCVLLKD
jgi:hypothetical protein